MFLKTISKVQIRVDVNLRSKIEKVLASKDDRELEKIIKEAVDEGRGFDEIRNAFISACKRLSIKPNSEIARRGLEWIRLYSRGQGDS